MRTVNWGNPKPLYSVGARFSFYLFFVGKRNVYAIVEIQSQRRLHTHLNADYCIAYAANCFQKSESRILSWFHFDFEMFSSIICMRNVIEYARVCMCVFERSKCVQLFAHTTTKQKQEIDRALTESLIFPTRWRRIWLQFYAKVPEVSCGFHAFALHAFIAVASSRSVCLNRNRTLSFDFRHNVGLSLHTENVVQC